MKCVFMLILACGYVDGCAQVKEAGRTVGHTTRDVATAIGHGARDVTRDIGHGARDAVQEIGGATEAAPEESKKVIKPPATPSEY